nr:phospholipid:diacylglycerol acyltransferase 1-like [Tanacetum cinerariifolium]
MYMAAYDWRLSFQNTEVRDRTLSRLKRNIEMMVEINGGEKAVIIPHSMGVL